MGETPKEAFMIGDTEIVVHSPLVAMTSEQRKEWFQKELENNNPILKEIIAAANDCFLD
ncbi:hypothetical protein [Sutcliffiella horikoshii]|uniref:hypothetical protein n=1 Tax=Sutcliffiella horikoshii TaxID=79883 RepID=UPI001653CAAC|nr:hypothetical protein [Sutcliffiella horikoshii]